MKKGREAPPMGSLSSGVFLLDLALLGGYPEGRITTLVGQKGTGKTTLYHKAVGNYQRKYDGVSRRALKVAWIDTEQSYDALWAEKNGVDIDSLILMQPPDGDAAGDIFNACLENDDIGLVVLDSIANLVSEKETEKSVSDMTMAPVATIAQRMLRISSTIIAKANAKGIPKTGLLINQYREKPTMMGDPRNLPGGKFIRFYSSVELEVYNKEIMEPDENGIASVHHNDQAFKIMKNRIGNSIREAEFVMNRRKNDRLPEAGIDDFATTVTYAQKFGMVTGAGSKWQLVHPYTGEVITTKSKTEITQMTEKDPELYRDLQRKVISLQRKKNGLSEDGWY